MPRLRVAHIPLICGAIARWLVGTRTGRKVFAVGAGATALAVLASGTGDADAAKRREGTWAGLYNEYAPNQGEFVLVGGQASGCLVRGRSGYASGDGWVFKGSLAVAEIACDTRIGPGGRVSGRLMLKRQWSGRVKGIGGDWDDERGTATCEGDVVGTLAGGGTWNGNCTRDDGKKYASSLTWTLRAD